MGHRSSADNHYVFPELWCVFDGAAIAAIPYDQTTIVDGVIGAIALVN